MCAGGSAPKYYTSLDNSTDALQRALSRESASATVEHSVASCTTCFTSRRDAMVTGSATPVHMHVERRSQHHRRGAEQEQKFGKARSGLLHDGFDRPTQPNKINSMNHAGETHQMKMGVFSRRVSLKLNSPRAKDFGQMLVTTAWLPSGAWFLTRWSFKITARCRRGTLSPRPRHCLILRERESRHP